MRLSTVIPHLISCLQGHTIPGQRSPTRILLQDDAPGVRLEAINVLGKYIRGSKDLELTYYNVVADSLADTAVSVRKTALMLLWDVYVMDPESGKATDACRLILQLASDNQDLNRDMVVKLIKELWFIPAGLPPLLFVLLAQIICLSQKLWPFTPGMQELQFLSGSSSHLSWRGVHLV